MQPQKRPQQQTKYMRRLDQNGNNSYNPGNVGGSNQETEEQLHNGAMNVILQSYGQIFDNQDNGLLEKNSRSWADQIEDSKEDNIISHVSDTSSNEVVKNITDTGSP